MKRLMFVAMTALAGCATGANAQWTMIEGIDTFPYEVVTNANDQMNTLPPRFSYSHTKYEPDQTNPDAFKWYDPLYVKYKFRWDGGTGLPAAPKARHNYKLINGPVKVTFTGNMSANAHANSQAYIRNGPTLDSDSTSSGVPNFSVYGTTSVNQSPQEQVIPNTVISYLSSFNLTPVLDGATRKYYVTFYLNIGTSSRVALSMGPNSSGSATVNSAGIQTTAVSVE